MDLKKFADLERKSGNPDVIEHADLKAAHEFARIRHRMDRGLFNERQRRNKVDYEVPGRFLRLELERVSRVREYCAWIVASEGDAVDRGISRSLGLTREEIVERCSMRVQCAALLHESAFFYCEPPYDMPCGMNPLYHAKVSRLDAYTFLTKLLHKSEHLAQVVGNAIARQNYLPYVREKICEPVDMPKEPDDWILRDAILLDDGDIWGMQRQLELRQLPNSIWWRDDDNGDFLKAWQAVERMHEAAFAQTGESGEVKTATGRAIRDGLGARTRRFILAMHELSLHESPVNSMESFREFFIAFLTGELGVRVQKKWNIL